MSVYQNFLFQAKSLKPFLKTVYYAIIGVMLAVPFILFMGISQLPIYLYRLIVTKLVAPFFHPEIGNAVTVSAQFQATEFLDDGNSARVFRYWIVGKHVLTGDISLETLQKLVMDRWVMATMGDGMELCYPEFQQYIEYWMGFMFWKQDPNFDVNNHIVHHDQFGTTDSKEEYVDQLMENLLNEPYPLKRSPWEVHLIKQYKSAHLKDNAENTVILFRFHHAMTDGYSIAHVVLEGLYGDKLDHIQIPVPRRNKTNNFIKELTKSIFLPLGFLADLGFVLSLSWTKESPWKSYHYGNLQTNCNDSRQIYHKSPLISLDKLKCIKCKFGVSLSSVLLSCLSTAISKSVTTGAWDTIRASMMLRTNGHQNKLRNFTLPTICELNTKKYLGPKDRLLAVQKRFTEAKQSFIPHILSSTINVLSGSLAASFASVPNWKNVPICISNFPGPQAATGLSKDIQVAEFDAALGAFADLVFMMTSYIGYIRINVTADSSVLNRVQVKEIIELFCEEVHCLYKLASQNETNVV